MKHKYYEIIDVISCADANLNTVSEYFQDRFNHNADKYQINSDNTPLFVLKDIQSMDIIYLPWGRVYHSRNYESIILVGGFVKRKEMSVGQNVVYYREYRNLEYWKIIDVSIADSEVVYVLQNRENTDIIKNIHQICKIVFGKVGDIQSAGDILFDMKDERLRTGSDYIFEKDWISYQSYMDQMTKQKNQQTTQAVAKRKQELTNKYGATTAAKIMAQTYEIGMSKAVCKEIGFHYSVIDKTETTETWKVNSIWSNATYLYFSNEKLVRISK